MSFWSEMKRRHVMRVVIAYVLVGVATGGAAEVFLPNLGAPEWVLPTVLALLILGLPVALVLAWAYEMTPSGIVRDTGSGEVAKAGKSGPSIPREQAVVETEHNSIAVLPFADMSPDGDQEYFGDGIAEELINALVKIPDFRVAARTSSFKFKGEKADVREIGRELEVSTVLEGSVRKEGDQLRVTAQLVSVHDGYHLWSETYDRSIEHIFAIQDELARAIVERCRVALGEDSPEPAGRRTNPRPTTSICRAGISGTGGTRWGSRRRWYTSSGPWRWIRIRTYRMPASATPIASVASTGSRHRPRAGPRPVRRWNPPSVTGLTFRRRNSR